MAKEMLLEFMRFLLGPENPKAFLFCVGNDYLTYADDDVMNHLIDEFLQEHSGIDVLQSLKALGVDWTE